MLKATPLRLLLSFFTFILPIRYFASAQGTNEVDAGLPFQESKESSETFSIAINSLPQKSKLQLGSFLPGEKCDFVVHITNATTSPLKVDRVSTSCGCVTTSPFSTSLNPNEAADLSLSFAAPNRAGRFAKQVLLTDTKSGVPVLGIELSGAVENPFAVTPTMFELSGEGELSLEIRPRKASGPVTIKTAAFKRSFFDLRSLERNGNAATLKFQLSRGVLHHHPFEDVLVLSLGGGRKVEVSIFARFDSDVMAIPSRPSTFPNASGGEDIAFFLKLPNDPGLVTSVVEDLAAVSVLATDGQSRFKLPVQITRVGESRLLKIRGSFESPLPTTGFKLEITNTAKSLDVSVPIVKFLGE